MPLKVRDQNVLIYGRKERTKNNKNILKQPKRSNNFKNYENQVMIIIVRFSGSAIFVCSERM